MPSTVDIEAVGKLSVKERLTLIERIWATIVEQNAELPIPPDVMAEMERRDAELASDPDSGMSLEEFRKSLRKRP